MTVGKSQAFFIACIEAKTDAGSWSHPLEPGKSPADNYLNSHKQPTREPIKYSRKDIEHIEKWGKWADRSIDKNFQLTITSATPC